MMATSRRPGRTSRRRICDTSRRADDDVSDGVESSHQHRSTGELEGANMLHVIPQSWPHWHILVSLLPSVGLFFSLCLYGLGMYADKDIIKRTCLIAFVVVALATVPTYLSGDYTMTALAQNPKISEARMDAHFYASAF